MKIVYVYPQFARLAGTERVLIDKMNYLADREGFEILMVTYEQGTHPMAYRLSEKVRHIDLDVRFYPLYKYNSVVRFYRWYQYTKLLKRRFNKLMAEEKPDIVITTTYHGNIMTMIDECPTPFVRILESHIDRRYVHSNDPANYHNWRTRIRSIYDMKVLDRVAGRFDILVALHSKDAADWPQCKRTLVIPNIVHLNDTGRYCDVEAKRVIFVGRYIYQKGIPDLFKVWKIVSERHPDWRLDIYGDGDSKEIPCSEEERLKMNVHVHPSDGNIFERYLESSIFVLTSVYETFGLVMPEAMSCGLPVVAFDCPFGPAKIISDGVDGFLIKDRNVEEYADKLCQLMESSDLRRTMGKAAIQSSQKYAADGIMAKWLKLFDELVKPAQS